MATVDVQCRYCSQTKPVKKHGTNPSGVARYRCLDCKRSFQLDYRYTAWEPGVKEAIVSMALDGAGVRQTQRHLKIGLNTVIRILKKSGAKTEE